MSLLDCNTPVGREAMKGQAATVAILERAWKCNIWITSDTDMADADAIVSFGDQCVDGVLEIKTRDLTKQKLLGFGTYLVTFDKLERCARLSNSLRVPFYLVIQCTGDGSVAWWKITDEDGAFCLPFDVRNTVTKRTCNGGEISRYNAYISTDYATWIMREAF